MIQGTMRAAVLRERQVRVRELPIPVPGEGQILVRSLACGICASDIHFMDHPEFYEVDDAALRSHDPSVDIVMGHEYCAEVVEYGPGTARKWPSGTRVSSNPVLIQPRAVRVVGGSGDAPGGFGQYFLMSELVTQEVRGGLPSELVAVSDAMAVGWHYVKRAALGPKEIPLVIGCGAIGLSVIAALRRLGIGPVIATDFSAGRRDVAKLLGADAIVDPAAVSPYAAWRELAYGSADLVRGIFQGLDLPQCVVFECVGRPGVLDSIVEACERETRIFSAGACPQGDHIHSRLAHNKGLNIQFGGGPKMADWNEALDEVCSGRIDVRPLVGEVVGLDEAPGALERARRSDGPARIVICPQK
jgi:threonine dehydrogenase-like Zn-dependent dehydrogenase